nr:hypothetical protein [Tanacetum cinerariifolium]
PKPKASARRKRGGSDSSTTPPTAVASSRPIITVVVAPRLTATAKGKQPARATSPIDPSEVERSEAEQLKIVLRRSRQETHISQHGGSGIDEGTDRVKSLEVNFSKFMQTNQFAEAVSRIPDTTVLKRRRGDDDDQKGPSAGSDQGSKRRREGGEPESASTSFEPTTRSASRRIIAVTDLKIVEWHNYKHIDWILVCRDDDKIYKFKDGDFKRLRLQDIEDMLL